MGQVIWGWLNLTEQANDFVFSGQEAAIAPLTTFIQNGHFIEGNLSGHAKPDPPSNSVLQASIMRMFYGFSIPVVWSLSGTSAFVTDSGYPCSTSNPLVPDYLTVIDSSATEVCFNNEVSYLVGMNPDATQCNPGEKGCISPPPFTTPPGLDALGNSQYAGLNISDLVIGSIRTYQANNNQNGGSTPPINDDNTIKDLYSQDITTPGFVRLPVCGPEEAHTNWQRYRNGRGSKSANYPCN
jgi:hypothetical protein